MSRFANQRIAQLVDYINTPVSSMTKGEYDPYFYGMSEQRWKSGQDKLHKYIKGSSRSVDDLADELSTKSGMEYNEAKALVDFSKDSYNTHSRHVDVGVPHAYQSEMLAKKALEASGTQAILAHGSNHLATDLEVMVGKVRRLMDVQNRYIRPGQSDLLSLGVIQNLRNDSGGRAWDGASMNTSLEDIVNNAKQMSNGLYLPDKLYQERGLSNVPQDQVKDLLISSKYDKSRVRNLVQARHGHYNPTAPQSGMTVIDMDTLRDNLYPMTKREIIDLEGQPIRDDSKIKLQIPMARLQELGQSARSQGMISGDVNDELMRLGRQ